MHNDTAAVIINNEIDYLFNEKLRMQTEYYLEMPQEITK